MKYLISWSRKEDSVFTVTLKDINNMRDLSWDKLKGESDSI